MAIVPTLWIWSLADFDIEYLIPTILLVVLFYMLFLFMGIFYNLGLDDNYLGPGPGADPP